MVLGKWAEWVELLGGEVAESYQRSVRGMTFMPVRLPAPPPGGRPQSDLRVAVFDGGVSSELPQLAPFVDAIDVTPEPPNPNDVADGTMVPARCSTAH